MKTLRKLAVFLIRLYLYPMAWIMRLVAEAWYGPDWERRVRDDDDDFVPLVDDVLDPSV